MWLEPGRTLGWEDAARTLGVTRSQLRRALDRARTATGPAPLSVEGQCRGIRFRAVRPAARRGVAWRFVVLGSAAPERRIAQLRGTIRRDTPIRAGRTFRLLLRGLLSKLRSA